MATEWLSDRRGQENIWVGQRKTENHGGDTEGSSVLSFVAAPHTALVFIGGEAADDDMEDVQSGLSELTRQSAR